jgi:hypothetical protein
MFSENTDEQLPPLNDNFQSMPEIKVTILGTEKLLKRNFTFCNRCVENGG